MTPEIKISLDRTKEILADITIPMRPVVVMEITEEQKRDEPDMQRIAEIISKDLTLTAGVLKIVNSSFFGMPRQIGSINQAVTLLGLQNISNIVMSLSLRSALGGIQNDFMERFWKNSTDMAMINAYLARTFRNASVDEAYVSGLFLNCGVPILTQRFPEYSEVYEDPATSTETLITVMEDAHFFTNHSLVGYMIGQSWELPEFIVECILHHHDGDVNIFSASDDSGIADHLAILKLSEHLCSALNNEDDYHEWSILCDPILHYLNIDNEKLEQLQQNITKLFKNAE